MDLHVHIFTFLLTRDSRTVTIWLVELIYLPTTVTTKKVTTRAATKKDIATTAGKPKTTTPGATYK